MARPRNNGRTTPKGTRPHGQKQTNKLQDLADQAMSVQSQVTKAKAAAAAALVEGTAADGLVHVVLGGDGRPDAVRIDESLLDGDADELSNHVLTALRNAWAAALEMQDSETTAHLDEIGGLDLRAMGLDDVL